MVLVAAAALAVLVGVVYIVLGKGGQLARFEADHPPLALPEDRPVKAFDLGRLMLPLAMWGYHVRAVDELLLRLTATLREREERIEDLEWRLSRLDPSYVPEGTGPIPGAHLPGDAYAPEQGARGPAAVGSTAVAGFRPGGPTGPGDSAARGSASAGAAGTTAPMDVTGATAPTEVIEGAEAEDTREAADERETGEEAEGAARSEGPGDPGFPRSPEPAPGSGGAEGSDGAGAPGDPTAAVTGERPEAAGGSGTADASDASPSRGDER
ncbi:Uncharacterised protein [Nocardiopsis dassonvillei]|uniref:Cell division protein DivIVA n=1 Tax=Nocardiopsis dassonvillei (strain ATCC 23218 / DSM 43111 / CIP 107115 / JCM 7437 / KCTC 9190 / NBRC 14626 / NCTC 10488 / NRRL B-5397 / IMRU 509) TaxID=446468 RepID=D7B6K7_NOCDD|nr:hypothetical protein Ndas_3897 [Nocardiopsis dassonvillei subsp. dassonvillei DSM 43111]VEI89803.1 Uncharacterised protein [Nocardiopsis dassonvillei]